MTAATGERPLIGVLGGLGPAATLDFYAKVLALTPAATDQEHVRLLIDADPEVPNRNDAVAGTGPSSGPALVAKAQRLKAAGAELLVMPCNAAHAYLGEILAAVDLPFISIVDEAVKAAGSAAPGARRIGVLATSGALRAGLYQAALKSRGLEALTLAGEHLTSFMEVIYAVKAGGFEGGLEGGHKGDLGSGRASGPYPSAELRDRLLVLATVLIDAGAEGLIAACTEVPLVIRGAEARQLPVPLIDATETLARAVVAAGRMAQSGAR